MSNTQHTWTADPNYAQPWQMRPQRSSSGSAFIVDTKRRHIMTNAHVVKLATTHLPVSCCAANNSPRLSADFLPCLYKVMQFVTSEDLLTASLTEALMDGCSTCFTQNIAKWTKTFT